MPTYDYLCQACNHKFDEFQSITAKPLRKCPKCGKSRLKRLIGTGAGIIFKGSGFYETDYRSESYKQAAKADSQASTPAASSDTTSAAKSADATTPAAKKESPAPATPATPAAKPKKSAASKKSSGTK